MLSTVSIGVSATHEIGGGREQNIEHDKYLTVPNILLVSIALCVLYSQKGDRWIIDPKTRHEWCVTASKKKGGGEQKGWIRRMS
jgi:hypothetical protein